jgi:hypothetical protein
MPWFEFKSRTFRLYYIYICFLLENRVCLSRGVQVIGGVWRVVMRIVAGVGDLVRRIGDGQAWWRSQNINFMRQHVE